MPTKISPKEDKLADRIARRNPKVYDENYDPVVLKEWVREMKKIFTAKEVPEEKKVKGGLVGPQFIWSKFLRELMAKFYPAMVQRQKEKEFMELKMSDNMTVMQYASKFTELSRFIPKFVSSKRLKMKRFERVWPSIIEIS